MIAVSSLGAWAPEKIAAACLRDAPEASASFACVGDVVDEESQESLLRWAEGPAGPTRLCNASRPMCGRSP